MATRKKTEQLKPDAGLAVAEDLVRRVADLYLAIDEIAGNSNYLADIAKALDRIAVALEQKK